MLHDEIDKRPHFRSHLPAAIPRWALSLEMNPETESNVRFFIPDDHWLQPGIVTVEDMEAQSDG